MQGASTLEGVIGLTLLVLGLVMPITGLVQKIAVTDNYARAARDAALAVAVLETAPATDADLQTVLCDAVKESLGRPTASCGDEWVLEAPGLCLPVRARRRPPHAPYRWGGGRRGQ